jgi:Protein of unknown function (DUF3072)
MSSKPPTGKQLSYLKTLAERAGQAFIAPETRSEASAEIRRLKAVRGNGFTFAELATEEASRRAHGDVAVVQPWELRGRGSSATWSQRS